MGMNRRKIYIESFGSLMRQAKSRYYIVKYKAFVPPSARTIVLCISRSHLLHVVMLTNLSLCDLIKLVYASDGCMYFFRRA